MSTFKIFANLVSKNLDAMYKNSQQLFLADVTKETMRTVYLSSYPKGTNDIFRERGHYECNADLNFVQNLGRVVTIKDGEIQTIWDNIQTGTYYDVVAKALSGYIKKAGVRTIFLTDQESFGSNPNVDSYDSSILWTHFYYKVPHVTSTPQTLVGNFDSKLATFKRSLNDLSLDTAETVLELICSGSLYRGAEHKGTVEYFIAKKKEYEAAVNKDLWLLAETSESRPVRNTVIGSLMLDLQDGVDIEKAVKSFESKVAPENYKRTSAPVTKGMIDRAEKVITESGYLESLDRRCANASDISINDVLFADRSIQKDMKDSSVFDSLKKDVSSVVKIDPSKAKKITVSVLEAMLPNLKSIKAYVENNHLSNFMTLVAPVHPQGDRSVLTPWNNEFTWSYNGDLADSSLKERVSKAGGNVKGDVRISLGWEISDDYDLSFTEINGQHIYFGNSRSRRGGELDVDANANRIVPHPVENICYSDTSNFTGGSVYVHNYTARSNTNSSEAGFTLEVDIKGVGIKTYKYNQPLKDDKKIKVCDIVVKNGVITINDCELSSTTASTEVYSIDTLALVPVNMVLNSPNHWDGDVNVGNKHTFFILEGAKTEESVRGFYNEFLKPELHEIRKTTELLGGRMKAQPTDDQLSGLGFSHTKDSNIVLQLTDISGKVSLVNVEFNK